MSRLSTSEQLRTVIVKLGGTPSGKTVAELVDEVEDLLAGSGGAVPAQIEAAVSEAVSGFLENPDNHGSLTDDEMDSIFGD